MNQLEMMIKSSKLLRDESNTIYTKPFINDQINEGIDRLKQLIPEMNGMVYLTIDTQSPILLPTPYHHLLSIYACARCYEVDERHYEANKYMNEFEIKVSNLKDLISSGELIILDPSTNNPVVNTIAQDFVTNVYYKTQTVSDSESLPVM